MHYRILHTISYTYSQPVALAPHLLRLRSRSDNTQTLHSFDLKIVPQPVGISPILDLEGNAAIKIWFDPTQQTEQFDIQAISTVETHRTNPFNYLLEPWAIRLPLPYPAALQVQLQPYLYSQFMSCPYGLATVADPLIQELAQSIFQTVNSQTDVFLTELNHQIHQHCQYIVRETGNPLPAAVTWRQQAGSCRDLVVVFMEACRAVGLAARFVSGYQEADSPDSEPSLHAWAEVYLPGGGWRGYDPTQGLMVTDRYVALAASALPSDAAPVTGNIWGSSIQSTQMAKLIVTAL